MLLLLKQVETVNFNPYNAEKYPRNLKNKFSLFPVAHRPLELIGHDFDLCHIQ